MRQSCLRQECCTVTESHASREILHSHDRRGSRHRQIVETACRLGGSLSVPWQSCISTASSHDIPTSSKPAKATLEAFAWKSWQLCASSEQRPAWSSGWLYWIGGGELGSLVVCLFWLRSPSVCQLTHLLLKTFQNTAQLV